MKVFSKEKCKEDTGASPEWANDADGHVVHNGSANGYTVIDDWCIDYKLENIPTVSAKYITTMHNELCQCCGKYKQAHDGACNGCALRDVPACDDATDIYLSKNHLISYLQKDAELSRSLTGEYGDDEGWMAVYVLENLIDKIGMVGGNG